MTKKDLAKKIDDLRIRVEYLESKLPWTFTYIPQVPYTPYVPPLPGQTIIGDFPPLQGGNMACSSESTQQERFGSR